MRDHTPFQTLLIDIVLDNSEGIVTVLKSYPITHFKVLVLERLNLKLHIGTLALGPLTMMMSNQYSMWIPP